MILTAVILILLCGVAYTVSSRDATPANGNATETQRPPHEILRSARVSANDSIEWEQNIGGSGADIAVSVIRKNNELYIFGNTDSGDFDFAGRESGSTRGFGARLSLAGSTLAFTAFDFTIAKVIPTSAGFAAAGNEGMVAGLYTLSDSLTVTGKVNMPPLHALTACGLYEYDNRYFLVAESLDEVTKRTSLLLHVYTSGLTLEREKLFSHTYSLKLLDLMPYSSGYILAASAQYQDLGYLTVARFTTISPPAFTDVNLGYKYVPEAFMPLGDGFAAVSDRDGNCELLLLGSNLVKNKVLFLTETPNDCKKTLFYAGAPYAFTGEKLIELGDDGRSVGSTDFDVTRITDFANNGKAAFAAGVKNGNLKILCLGGNETKLLLPETTGTTRALISLTANGLTAVSDINGKSRDCGDFFGGTDVWISKFPL